MRNEKFTTKRIFNLVENLPSFDASDLAPIDEERSYLNVVLSRQVRRGVMVRLRKNLYVARKYLDTAEKKGFFSDYVEFTANKLYPPSYLSLDYVLHEHNMLTELPRNITSVALRKTDRFTNELGNFIYHKIKEELYLGFKLVKKGNFSILKGTKAKALFDFLYFRKRLLVDKEAVSELRLNLDEFNKGDVRELESYVELEGSKRMKEILGWLK